MGEEELFPIRIYNWYDCCIREQKRKLKQHTNFRPLKKIGQWQEKSGKSKDKIFITIHFT